MEDRKVERTFHGLRNALFDEVDSMRSGTGDLERVRALVMVTGRINDTIHAEIKARKLIGNAADDISGVKAML